MMGRSSSSKGNVRVICGMAPPENELVVEQLIARVKCVNRVYVSGPHGIPAARTVCQKSAARNATTIMQRIRPRLSITEAVSSWEVSRSGSLVRNYSVARQ
jgi:hypothetical protein